MTEFFDDLHPDQPAARPPADTAPPTPLFYGSVEEFVRKHLRYHYRRTVGRPGRADYRWRADWWRNEEALARLDALWRAWEAARTQPSTRMSDWWLNHCDRHMQALLSPTGPFAISQDSNNPGDPLPCTPAPPGMFNPDRQPDE